MQGGCASLTTNETISKKVKAVFCFFKLNHGKYRIHPNYFYVIDNFFDVEQNIIECRIEKIHISLTDATFGTIGVQIG